MPVRLLSLPLLLLTVIQTHAEQVVLHKDNFQHIHFRRIQPTQVTFGEDTIRFEVNRSSSFLLLPFAKARTVQRVSFEWKADGMLNKVSADQEKTRTGDDAWLRVGLIIGGQPDLVPEALLPRWVRQVRNTLKHPSDKMIYLIPDAMHAPGASWRSPYNAHITMVSVESRVLADGWKRAHYEFIEPQQAVGIWLMADGDNTDSVFSSQLRNLVID